MRLYLLALPVFLFTAAQAADPDTLCATVYTYLAENARSTGMSSAVFEAAASRAQEVHLALNPAEDPQRYALTVIDGAEAIRNGLARGVVTSDAVVSAATSCNTRYDSVNVVQP